MNEKWFSLSVAETEKKLKTNAASGLSRRAARSAWYKAHRASPASHTLFIRKNKKASKMFAEVIGDFSLIILLLAALFAMLFDERSLGIAVAGISVISVGISFVFYYRSQRAMEQLNLYFMPTAKVIRGGKLYRVCFENVVPGDVILLEQGDIVPADARIVTSDNLYVAMRVGMDKYIPLKKQAQALIKRDEINPAKMLNILHAASIVESGNARAIVYATGTYTYIGAMTGGIPEFYSDNVPGELKKMKKICSKLGLFSMLAILPFSILSLLLSHMSGGTATLSAAFLTALAISASSMTQLSCTICKVFFIKKIKDISKNKNPAVVRTTDAFDKLGDMKYLFMLDGAAVTDGVLHFEAVFTVEGEQKSFTTITPTASLLFELATIYNHAESNMLSVGMNMPDRFKVGLDELLSNGNVDAEALKIRCPMRSYMPGTDSSPTDRVFYTDTERKMVLEVSRELAAFDRCSYAITYGKPSSLTNTGRDKLKHTYNIHASKGKTVLVFTLYTLDGYTNHSSGIFVGSVVLREGIDKNALSAIDALAKKGVKVISFAGENTDCKVPQIPVELHGNLKVSKEDFKRGNLPITYKFGVIDTYYGFDEKDILVLLENARNNGDGVGVIGFTDSMTSVIEKSDVFISCAPIINVLSAKSEEELYTLEMAGAANSSSCIQTVKSESDVLFPRPNGSNGGIISLVGVLSAVQAAYRNLNSFFKYMIAAQFIRIITVGLPMAFGKPILDARHVLLCSFLIDIFVLLILSDDKTPVPNNKTSQYKIKSLGNHISSNKILMLCSLISSIVSIVLPMLTDSIGIFGPYLYRVEYLLCTMLWLHMLLAYYIRYGSIFNIKMILKNKMLIGLMASIPIFLILTFLIKPLGLLFEMFALPIAYLAASFIPSILFCLLMEFLPHVKKVK